MQKRTYLTGALQEATDACGPVAKSLLAAMEQEHLYRLHRMCVAMMHAATADGADIQHIENIVLGQTLFQVVAMASAVGTMHGQAFDPAEFGRFAERIAREFAPMMAEVEAAHASRTAAKN